ncbi:uncharacterized protein LOC122289323 [Carya illinoinensis]|uniref:uncharacterized protein LOC122289323 n=1 Tax=Carya illinoinensis TaxID=32201 RepID=UPI001C71AF61|nr:uncharacterized protein LOC122289323 [Carya illinoinensis]
MRGEWNELQALFLKDCPYAYYVHYFAYRLKLALVAASREVVSVHEFFSNLDFIINVVGVSCKRHDELQAAQQKSQDILNAMNMVSTTKGLIQKLRNEGCGRHQRDDITIERHYHFEIFNVTINFQMQELDNRFSEGTKRLFTLSSALDPKDVYKSFNIDDICCLVEDYYPLDFSENEKINLRFQLKHFEVDVFSNPMFQDLRSIADLCRKLLEIEKSKTYYLIDRLVRLILTLPMSTATSERAFSVMKIVKIRLRNKIEDEFLANN